MGHLELPLVLFTVFTQMAIGLVFVSAVQQWAFSTGTTPGDNLRLEWIAVLGLLGVGVVASFFHLGHPLGAVRMLANLDTAWLSREILFVGMFGGLAAITLFMVHTERPHKWLITATAAAGLLALFSMARTYAPPSLPAIDNGLPIAFFGLTALILGSALASYFVSEAQQPMLTIMLAVGLSISLILYLIVPGIWLSGGTVTQLTGQLHLASPLYWTHLIVGLALPLAVLIWQRRIPVWLPILLLIGEFSGRIIFFTLVVSSAANLGNIY